MSGTSMVVTIVNHLAVDVDARPDILWGIIRSHFVEPVSDDPNIAFELLVDPAASLGAYRRKQFTDGVLVDDRITHITEIDEAARRLSLFGDFVSVPGGAHVFATYQAQERGEGARYTIDCHTRLALDPTASGHDTIEVAMAATKAGFETHLDGYMSGVKAKAEAAG